MPITQAGMLKKKRRVGHSAIHSRSRQNSIIRMPAIPPPTNRPTTVVVNVSEAQMATNSRAICRLPICDSRSRPNSHSSARLMMVHSEKPSTSGQVTRRHTSPENICAGISASVSYRPDTNSVASMPTAPISTTSTVVVTWSRPILNQGSSVPWKKALTQQGCQIGAERDPTGRACRGGRTRLRPCHA